MTLSSTNPADLRLAPTAGESGFDRNNVKQWGFRFRPEQYRFYNVYRGFNGAEFFDKEITKTRFNEPEGVASMQKNSAPLKPR